jgi:hypothetical protein
MDRLANGLSFAHAALPRRVPDLVRVDQHDAALQFAQLYYLNYDKYRYDQR